MPVVGSVGNGSPVYIEIKYELLKNEVGFRIYFDLCEANGEILAQSFFDEKEVGVSHMKSGVYCSKTFIPENFLSDNNYILVINATIHNKRSCMGNGIRVPLAVINDSCCNKTYPDEPYRCKLGIMFDWKTEKTT